MEGHTETCTLRRDVGVCHHCISSSPHSSHWQRLNAHHALHQVVASPLAARVPTPAPKTGLGLTDIEDAVAMPDGSDPDAPREYDDDVVLHEGPSPKKGVVAAPRAGGRRTTGTTDY